MSIHQNIHVCLDHPMMKYWRGLELSIMSLHNRANDNHMWGRNISIAVKSFSTYFGLTWCRSTQRSGGSGCASTKRLSNCCVAREKYQKFPSVQTIGLSCSIASMEWRKTVSTSASKSRKTSGVAEETSCRYLHESRNNSNQTKISRSVTWKPLAGDSGDTVLACV